jgi:thiopurine S-methyltransferase
VAGVFLKEVQMEHEFWHERWNGNRIGFHVDRPNPLLVTHFDALRLAKGSRVFVPLCGKTLDIGWFWSHGYRIAGAELSELAIIQLFEDLGVDPSVSEFAELKLYSAPGIDIFVGDIFALTPALLGEVDAVFDRAALVALPSEMREAYAAHLVTLTNTAPQLLICFEYDQSRLDGPPFSIDCNEVRWHYSGTYEISGLERKQVDGGMKGVAATESVWLLNPR